MVFHKDQCGILLKVIIRTVLIQFYGVVKWHIWVELRGDKSYPIFHGNPLYDSQERR